MIGSICTGRSEPEPSGRSGDLVRPLNGFGLSCDDSFIATAAKVMAVFVSSTVRTAISSKHQRNTKQIVNRMMTLPVVRVSQGGFVLVFSSDCVKVKVSEKNTEIFVLEVRAIALCVVSAKKRPTKKIFIL